MWATEKRPRAWDISVRPARKKKWAVYEKKWAVYEKKRAVYEKKWAAENNAPAGNYVLQPVSQ